MKRTPEQYREEYHPWQRFRPYRVWNGSREPDWILAAGSKTLAGCCLIIAEALEDGTLRQADAVGILDTQPWGKGKPGTWVLNPYARRVQ